MSLVLDFDLTSAEREVVLAIPPTAWFTHVKFRNAASPLHPQAMALDQNHEMKRSLLLPWIKAHVKGKRVLDLFCANGAFSFEAAMAGAKEVLGVEFSEERVACAQALADIVREKTEWCVPKFSVGSVYELGRMFTEPFDVVMCLGGLYHIPDPPYVLDQIRALTGELLIVQTSSILSGRGSWGEFRLRQDETGKGMTSVIGGRGAWHLTVECFENMLRHAGFTIMRSCRPPVLKRRRFPLYCALAQPSPSSASHGVTRDHQHSAAVRT